MRKYLMILVGIVVILGVICGVVLAQSEGIVEPVDLNILDLIEVELKGCLVDFDAEGIRVILAQHLIAADYDNLSDEEILTTVRELLKSINQEQNQLIYSNPDCVGLLVAGAIRLRNHGFSQADVQELVGQVTEEDVSVDRISNIVRKRIELRKREDAERQQERIREKAREHEERAEEQADELQERISEQARKQEQKGEQVHKQEGKEK